MIVVFVTACGCRRTVEMPTRLSAEMPDYFGISLPQQRVRLFLHCPQDKEYEFTKCYRELWLSESVITKAHSAVMQSYEEVPCSLL